MGDQGLGQTRKWIFSNDIVAGAGSELRQREDGHQPPVPAHIHPGDIGQLAGAMSEVSSLSQHNINNNFTQIISLTGKVQGWQCSNNEMFPI